jgi:hypothetical protein
MDKDEAALIKELIETDGYKRALKAIEGLPADWLAHMLMLHGFIHGDIVAAAAGALGAEWLGANTPGGTEIPELSSCIASNIVMLTGCTVEQLAAMNVEDLAKYSLESMEAQNAVDKKAKSYMEARAAKVTGEGFVYAQPDWDKQVH